MHIRKSSRVVLLNDRNEIFLVHHRDSRRTYWVTPGGGVEEGETWEEAALRKMWEETGLTDVPLGPCIWTREKQVSIFGEPMLGQERYYLVRCGNIDVRNDNQLASEREVYAYAAWWSIADIRASAEVFWPDGLADLLAPVIAGALPYEPLHLTR